MFYINTEKGVVSVTNFLRLKALLAGLPSFQLPTAEKIDALWQLHPSPAGDLM